MTADAVAATTKRQPGVTILHESLNPSTTLPVSQDAPRYALHFDGTNSFVDLPVPYETGLPITIEASIVREPVLHNDYARIVACEMDWTTAGLAAFLHVGRGFQTAIIASERYIWTPDPYMPVGNVVPVLKRTLVALSYDGTTLRAFLDGKTVGVYQAVGVHTGLKLHRMTLGKHSFESRDYYQGIIDEVRISSICRYTEDYIPTARFEPDEHSEGLFHLDEGDGDIVRDSSGKGRDGTIFGAKWIREEDSTK